MAILFSGRFGSGSVAGGRNFVTDTKVWAGGTSSFETAEPIFLMDEGIVVGDGMVLKAEYPDQVTDSTANETFNDGLIVLRNSTIDMSFDASGGVTHAGRSKMSWDLENVTFTSAGDTYSPFGAWVTDSAGAIPRFVNVSFLGPVTFVNYQSTLSPFFGAAGTSKTFTGGNADTGGNRTVSAAFENVSYWNGQSLESGRCLGASPQLFTGAPHDAPTFGPFGVHLNSSGGRCIVRFSNVNNPNSALTNRNLHNGISTGLDMRSLEQVRSNLTFYIAADSGAHIKHINPLLGTYRNTPNTADTRPVFARQFGGGAIQEVWVATNPQVSANSGDHRYTFTQDQVGGTEGLLLMPATWDINTYYNNNLVSTQDQTHDNIANGFAIRQQQYEGTSNNNTLSVTQTIAALNQESYRKYSWTQQPGDDTFGRSISIAVPGDNASDADVELARQNGFDAHNGVSFTSSTDVNDPVDLITSQSAVDTPTKANTVINQLGGVNTGSYAVVAAKYEAWVDSDVNTLITDDNLRVNLNYTISGRTVVFDHDLGLSGTLTTATRANLTSDPRVSDGLSLPIGDLAADEFIDRIEGHEVTITGTSLNTETVKATIVGNTEIDTIGATISNATLIGGTGNSTNSLGTINDVTYSSISTTGITTMFAALGSNNSITAEHTFNAGFFNTGDGNFIDAPTVTNWNAGTATHGTTTFGRDTTITLSNIPVTNPTISSINIFGQDDFTGGNAITINANAPVTIQTDNTVGTNVIAGTNVSFEILPATFTVTPIITTGGRWAVVRSNDGTFTDSPEIVQAARNVDGSQFLSIANDDTRVYRVYLKQDTVITNSSVDAYYIRIADYTTDSTKATPLTDASPEQNDIPRFVISDNTMVDTGAARIPGPFVAGLGLPPSADGSPLITASASTSAAIDLVHSNLIDAPGQIETVALYVQMTNSDNWFNWHVANSYGENSVEFLANNNTNFLMNRARGISLTGAQQSVNQVTGLVSVQGGSGTDTYTQVISFEIGVATIGTVTNSLTRTLNNSQTGQNVAETLRITEWAADDGSRTGKFKPNPNGQLSDYELGDNDNT